MRLGRMCINEQLSQLTYTTVISCQLTAVYKLDKIVSFVLRI